MTIDNKGDPEMTDDNTAHDARIKAIIAAFDREIAEAQRQGVLPQNRGIEVAIPYARNIANRLCGGQYDFQLYQRLQGPPRMAVVAINEPRAQSEFGVTWDEP
jgi:hypothetical protein